MGNKLKKMYKGMANSPETFLMEELSEFETMPGSITVQSTAGFPDEGYLTLENPDQVETIKYEGKTDDKFTNITRDIEGTGIYTWNVGVEVARNFNNIDYETLIDNIKIINDDIEDEVKPSIGALEKELEDVDKDILNLSEELRRSKEEVVYTISNDVINSNEYIGELLVVKSSDDLGEVVNKVFEEHYSNNDDVCFIFKPGLYNIDSVIEILVSVRVIGETEDVRLRVSKEYFLKAHDKELNMYFKNILIVYDEPFVIDTTINGIPLSGSIGVGNFERLDIEDLYLENVLFSCTKGPSLLAFTFKNNNISYKNIHINHLDVAASSKSWRLSGLFNNSVVQRNLIVKNSQKGYYTGSFSEYMDKIRIYNSDSARIDNIVEVNTLNIVNSSISELDIGYVKDLYLMGSTVSNGFVVDSVDNAFIVNNQFKDAERHGLFLKEVNGSFIVNNIFDGNFTGQDEDSTTYNNCNLQIGVYNNENKRSNNNTIAMNTFIGSIPEKNKNKGVYVWGHDNLITLNVFKGHWRSNDFIVMLRGEGNITEISGNLVQPEEILRKAAPMNLEIPEMINEDVEGELSIKSPPAENEENIEKED